jgi:predicted SnoaL-like aldol condensation-catalyzing enzyme
MTKKEIASAFLQSAATGNVKQAYEKFVDQKFIHHNQYFKGDRNSLLVAMEEAHHKAPNKTFEIKNIYEDANTVITHSLVIKETVNIAVVHIFRFEKDKIRELWDLGQVIDSNSPNENGPF